MFSLSQFLVQSPEHLRIKKYLNKNALRITGKEEEHGLWDRCVKSNVGKICKATLWDLPEQYPEWLKSRGLRSLHQEVTHWEEMKVVKEISTLASGDRLGIPGFILLVCVYFSIPADYWQNLKATSHRDIAGSATMEFHRGIFFSGVRSDMSHQSELKASTWM